MYTNEWMSTEAASAFIGVTPRTLYRFIDEGQLQAYRFGRVIRLKTADVEAYIGGVHRKLPDQAGRIGAPHALAGVGLTIAPALL